MSAVIASILYGFLSQGSGIRIRPSGSGPKLELGVHQVLNIAHFAMKWAFERARQDSNLRPLTPQASALSS